MEKKPDGEKTLGLKFAVILPQEVADVFLAECEDEDRDMSDMGRHIIKKYFREKRQRKDYEDFSRLRKEKSVQSASFSEEPLDLQQDADA